ncbi:precorrin-3B synthase [Streptomyces sp. NPDC017993]|uniref:precorrin-3B synthase n=1 Tax=Streptomyces sp. NPDC017993 TaxID=3365027 RepID=UPI0037B7C30A
MPPSPSLRPAAAAPPLRERGDACPGTLRLHSADDGSLARVRLPAGDLTARQASALADAAERLGDGHLSLTSRGNVELRGLADDCGQELAELLRDAGLLPSERHERVRNILASPLAGLDRRTPADVRLWARRLDALLCASASATALSGRFLFVLDDGRGDVTALGGDVRLVAEPCGGARESVAEATAEGGALLYVGDDPAAVRIGGPDVPRAALVAAEAFLTAAAASGSGAWRVRELPATHTLTARGTAEALRAAGIRAAYVPEPEPRPAPDHTNAPVPGIVEGPAGPDGSPGPCALSVLAPLGRLTVDRWRLLTAVAADDGAGALRVTPWRGVIVPGLSAATATTRLRELADAGLLTDPASPWHRTGACTGRPGCAKSLSDVRADAVAVLTDSPAGPPGLPVHWSGCARRCGHPHGTWVDVLATEDGYEVSVVGPEGRRPIPLAAADDAPPAATSARLQDVAAAVSRATAPPPAAP